MNKLENKRICKLERGIYFCYGQGLSVRWLDSIEQDIQILGIAAWRTNALDRNQWRKVVKVFKDYSGL